MSMDKRHALDRLLADILREPPLIPTHVTSSPATYFDELESEAFDEPESEAPAAPAPALHAAREMHATAEVYTRAELPACSGVHAPTQAPTSSEVRAIQGHISAELQISAAEEKAVKLAAQSKALLARLDRDTAIRLRWAMRDIKAKRIKLTPVAPNDLEALLRLGFVAIVDEKPVLTDAGFLALD
jgi:hypothetical protein